MRLLALDDSTVDANFRWIIATHLQILERIVCGTPVSKADQPGMDEGEAVLHRAIARRDAEAEDEALGDMTKAHLRAWWQEFSEQHFLTELYGRSERREDEVRLPRQQTHSLSSRGPPGGQGAAGRHPRHRAIGCGVGGSSHHEGSGRLLLPPFSVRSRDLVRGYIQSSRSRQVFFDALHLICAELDNRGEAIGRQLSWWRQEVVDGRLRRPRMKPIPARRPANPSQFARDIHLQFTVEILDRVCVPPRGNSASGCRIVAEASRIPIDTIERIWKVCPWRTSFVPMLQKHSKDIAERHLLRRVR